ncbi:hypothetical protein FS749_012217 [Ceratobasidium sp. UAMH 11750]|nr:hypothetical protein FS749_012217 [Ceratobasidium sp. UAMH 11750]
MIQGIYAMTVEVEGEQYKFRAVMIQWFLVPEVTPVFPWDFWDQYLGIDTWEFDHLGPLKAVPLDAFTGVFTLSDIEMTYSHYWITCAMFNTEPQDLAKDYD